MYLDTCEYAMTSTYQGVNVLSKDTIVINGKTWGNVVSDISNPAIDCTVRQVITFHREKFLIFTFGSSRTDYGSHVAEFDIILNEIELY
jgi:hypothetical protein